MKRLPLLLFFIGLCLAGVFALQNLTKPTQITEAQATGTQPTESEMGTETSPQKLAFEFTNPQLTIDSETTAEERQKLGSSETKNQQTSTQQATSNSTAATKQYSAANNTITLPNIQLPETSQVATAKSNKSAVPIRKNPNEKPYTALGSPTQFGSPRVFQVLDSSQPDYVKVALPLKPNGQEGWVSKEDVDLTQVRHKALVNLQNNSLTVWEGDTILLQTKAVTGKSTTPTPLGTFYVRDIIPQANSGGAYGPYIVALSGFSEVLETFGGGLPAIAIHGTNSPGLVGQNRSNGCIRIPNDLISQLAGFVPLGTPVTIVG